MKSAIFRLDMSSAIVRTLLGQEFETRISVPTVSAYAVEFANLLIGGRTLEIGHDCFQGDVLVIHSTFDFSNQECKLVIHYHGIRNYSLLFPHVEPVDLRNRLADFYVEAEVSFENAAWLTFMLMCGAIFEGLLYWRLDANITFQKLIDRAKKNGLISAGDAIIMHKVRECRNLVHAAKHTFPYVSRADAMDTRRLLDGFVRSV